MLNQYRKFLLIPLVLTLSCAPARSADLLQFDFNGPNPWPQAAADVMPSTPVDVTTIIEVKDVGTVDAAKPATLTGGLILGADVGEVDLQWSAIFTSGLFAVTNTEQDLGKLKLGFHLSASSTGPVTLQIESFDAKKRRTGGLETVIVPKTPNAYEKCDLGLSTFKSFGQGEFSPADPFIQYTFILGAPGWKDQASHRIYIDDLIYANS